MVLGFSYGEVALLLGASVALIGPKDLPVIARAAGRLTGKAVGFLQTMRGQMDDALQRTQVQEVQKELREAMSQLEAIRHEIHSGMSIMQPGPLTRDIFEKSTLGAPATNDNHHQEVVSDDFMKPISTRPQFSTKGLAQSSVEMQSQATAFARLAEKLTADVQYPAQTTQSTLNTPLMQTGQAEGAAREQQQMSVLPISALSAGFLPQRTGQMLTGSELVLESLVEKRVAQQALEFFKQPDSQN